MEKEMVDMRVQNIAPEPRMPSRKPKARKGKTLFIVCILAIPILNWLVFWFWVNIQSILLAFQIETVDGISFGLTHFADFWEAIVKENGDLGLSMKNTALYFLSSAVITMPLSLLISYFLSKKILGYQVFRIVLYLPCILSPIILTSIYDQFLSPRGPLGVLCQNLNLSYPLNGPLKTPESMLPTFTIIIYTILTGFGGDMGNDRRCKRF
jgi:ABC-type sugar transport system permease subunit